MSFATVALVAVAAFILWITRNPLVLRIVNYLALPFGRFLYYGSANGSSLTVLVPEASSKAASAECKLQSTTQSPIPRLNKPLPSGVGRRQTGSIDRQTTNAPNHRKPRKGDMCPTSRRGSPPFRSHCKLPRKAVEVVLLPLLQSLDSLPAVAVVFILPSASARPTGGTKSEQTSGQFEWVVIPCLVMVFAGFAWSIWLPYSTLTSKLRQRCSHLCGGLSLIVAGVWTAILFTVKTKDDRHYLALAFWSMVTVPFIAESYRSARHRRRYATLMGPTLIAVLNLAFWLFPRLTGSGAVRWTSPSTYEGMPGPFALWAIFSCWMRNKSVPVVDVSGRGGNNNTAGRPPTIGGGRDGGADFEMDGVPGSTRSQ